MKRQEVGEKNMHILYINAATLFFNPHAIMWLQSHATWGQGFQVWSKIQFLKKYFNILRFQNIFKNARHY
jgi:hypothetical protein